MKMPKKATPHNQSPAGGKRGQTKKSNPKPWEPSAEHMRWYEMWAVKNRSYRRIGREVGRDHKAVLNAVKKVSDWIRQECWTTVMEYRYRQTEALDEIAANALDAWEKSIGEHKVTTEKAGSGGDGKLFDETSTKTEELNGNSSYLTVAMNAMAEIRKIWGVDKAQKLELTTNTARGEGLERVDGMCRSEALMRRANLLMERAKLIEKK